MKFALISGGGAGHEPSFAGFVGHGLLDAAVSGTVFASPSAEQVGWAIGRVVRGGERRGVCVVVMNYTVRSGPFSFFLLCFVWCSGVCMYPMLGDRYA